MEDRAKVYTAQVCRPETDAKSVTVDVEITNGIGIHLRGLSDVCVRENLLRVVTAMQSLGYHLPGKKITINLEPTDLGRDVARYDVPVAVGIVAANGHEELPLLDKYLISGELGLDGSVRYVTGARVNAELAAKSGMNGVILPARSAAETAPATDEGLKVFGVETLADVFRILRGEPSDDLLMTEDNFMEESTLTNR